MSLIFPYVYMCVSISSNTLYVRIKEEVEEKKMYEREEKKKIQEKKTEKLFRKMQEEGFHVGNDSKTANGQIKKETRRGKKKNKKKNKKTKKYMKARNAAPTCY